VSGSSRPSFSDITRALAALADRVAGSDESPPEPYVSERLRSTVTALQTFIPGLDPAPDPEAARGMLRGAELALQRGDGREGLARALRGLSYAPHHPQLWYVAASASFELGGVEDALRLLYHTLWIHPGHRAARDDLQALTAFFEGNDEGERAA
jgi:hypothetical protein